MKALFRFRPTSRRGIAAKGYWEDKSLRDEFAAVFAEISARVSASSIGDRQITYAELDRAERPISR